MLVTKRLEIDAGHRLLKHEGKCRHLHGHRYAFEIGASADQLDEVGRVVDFSVIKTVVGSWLDEFWDHAFIAQTGDPIIEFLCQHKMRHYILDVPPTAENLAAFVLHLCRTKLAAQLGVYVLHVRCWETPTSSAWANT